MSNVNATITLSFKDMFSAGIRKAASIGSRSIKGVGGALKNLGGENLLQASANMSLVGGHASRVAGAVAGATNAMSSEASGFESSMSAVRSSLAISVGAGAEMEEQYGSLTSAAQVWSREHSDSASEYANTSYMMLSAGLKTEEAIQGTNSALLLAKATMGDATEAGNLLATAWNNMGRDGESAEAGMARLSDVIAKTQSMFQLKNLSQLGEGLNYAVAAAKPAGMEMEQVATIIGALNGAGMAGSRAGTAFAASLRNIDRAGKKLGFDVVYDQGGGLDFIKTLGEIERKFGEVEGRTAAQRQALEKAFGSEGVAAVNLLGANVAGLEKNFVQIQSATGTTETMAAEMADTYSEKLKTAQNAVNNFKAKLGEGANDVRLFSAQMGAGLAGFGLWATELPGVGGALGRVAGGALQLGGDLLGLASAGLSAGTGIMSFMMIAEKIGGLGRVSKVIGNMGKAVFKIIPAMIGWAATAWSAAAAHIVLHWPVYAIIAGIAALATGIFFLIKNWKTVVGFMKTVVVGAFMFVKNAIVSVGVWFGKIASNPLIAAAGMIFAPFIAIPAMIMKYWEPIKDFFGKLFGTIGKVLGAVGSFLGFGEKDASTGGGVSARTGLPYGGARAMGGAVSAGTVYKVGERGVEYFAPNTAGTMIPNRDISQAGGSAPQQPVYIHVENIRMDAPRDMQHMLDLFTQLVEMQQIR